MTGQNSNSIHKARILDAIMSYLANNAAGRHSKSTVKPNATTANLFATPDDVGQAQAEMTGLPTSAGENQSWGK